jgi:hypothetical protein
MHGAQSDGLFCGVKCPGGQVILIALEQRQQLKRITFLVIRMLSYIFSVRLELSFSCGSAFYTLTIERIVFIFSVILKNA